MLSLEVISMELFSRSSWAIFNKKPPCFQRLFDVEKHFNVGMDNEIFGVYSDYQEQYDNITRIDHGNWMMLFSLRTFKFVGTNCDGDTCRRLARWTDKTYFVAFTRLYEVRYLKVSHIITSGFLKRRELINIEFCTGVRCGTSPFCLV